MKDFFITVRDTEHYTSIIGALFDHYGMYWNFVGELDYRWGVKLKDQQACVRIFSEVSDEEINGLIMYLTLL